MRIGGVPYGVGAPLMHGLMEDPAVAFRRDPPTDLARMLREDALDAALLSSIEAFRHPGYRILPSICIASRGPARSVRAFVKPDRTIETLGVDSGSATSVTLLKILLHHGQLGPVASATTTTAITPTVTPDVEPFDVVMMIGDCGLAADPGTRRIVDLGEAWFAWTGLPFVYALWLLTPGADAARIGPRLERAREDSIAAQVTDGTEGAIYYDLGAEERAGLERFRAEAVALDLADPSMAPAFL